MNKFTSYINDCQSFLIITSRPLDFDCLGSGLLIKKYLEQLKNKVTIIHTEKIKEKDLDFFSVIPFFKEVQMTDSREILKKQKFDCLIFVDGMNLGQFMDSTSEDQTPLDLTKYPKRVHVDHHSANDEKLGTLTFYHPEYSSATEVVLKHLVPESFLTPQMATLGYAGIIGDTGNFKWNFQPQTFKIMSTLLEKGADFQSILDGMYFKRTRSGLEAVRAAIEYTTFDQKTHTSFLFLPQDFIRQYGLTEEATAEIKLAFQDFVAKSLPEFPRGIVMHEKEPNVIYLSGRGHSSRNKLSFVPMFQSLGGSAGGHFNAAGAKVEGKFDKIKNKLISYIKTNL